MPAHAYGVPFVYNELQAVLREVIPLAVLPVFNWDYTPPSLLTQNLAFTGKLAEDIALFFAYYGAPEGCPDIVLHSSQVAAEAGRVAALFGEDVTLAQMAGWLHDVSAIFPSAIRVEVAKAWGLPVLAEEEQLPMIVHQKLSKVLAHEVFAITDPLVLSAVGCHTTLRVNATRLDKVLFVADKIAWDQPGLPPYYDDIVAALERSLDHAAFVYLRYLWERRDALPVWHPWARDAYYQLAQELEV